MNTTRLQMLCCILMIVMIGCAKNEGDPELAHVDEENHHDVSGEIDPSISEPTTQTALSDLGIEGDIKNIYYASRDTMIIAADKLYVYDIESDNVLHEGVREDFMDEHVWTINSGYVAVGQTISNDNGAGMMTDDGFNYQAVFYDHDLNVVSTFALNELLEDGDMFSSINGFSFSTTGDQMAYATYDGMYVYDFETKEKNTVINLVSEDAMGRAGIVNIEQIGFTHDDEKIAFKAQSFDIPPDPDQPSFDTCGVVNVDGSGLSNETFAPYTCRKLTAYNDHLFFAEDPIIATGRTLVMDIRSGEMDIFDQMDKDESGNISGSHDGNYFATSMSDDSGWTVRLYETKTGKLVGEQHLSIGEEKRYLDRHPIIKIIDESRTFIVLFGTTQDDVATKMMINQF